MAWFWNSREEEEEEEDDDEEYNDDEDDDEYLSGDDDDDSQEDFAEKEDGVAPGVERRGRGHAEDADDDPPNDAVNDVAKGQDDEDIISSKESVEERGRANSGDSYMREDEFAQLVGGGPRRDSSSSSMTLKNHTNNEPSAPATTNGSNPHRPTHAAKAEDERNPDEMEEPPNEAAQQHQDAEQEEEEVTTLEEKQSLLTLAAEHDRVDILQAILSNPDDVQKLLHGSSSSTLSTAPPLHVAIAHGSVNAVNCLLRMGADPSIRSVSTDRYNGKTAWEVAFDSKGGAASSIAPSKREGIRHAFTAEALRCIGADEVERLRQLLDAGLPNDCEVGGRSLAEWTVDLGAAKCQELVGADPAAAAADAAAATAAATGNGNSRNRMVPYEKEGLPALENRLDELNNLSKALSQFLDNLAEEVSVCSGLLLVGSGAAALAAHVKSLRQQKITLASHVENHNSAWENAEDELAYWVKECGGVDILQTLGGRSGTSSVTARRHEQEEKDRIQKQQQQQQQTSGSSTKEETNNESDDTIIKARQRLHTQIAACETKIRMLRASIADLSDENQRNLLEVDRRGLQGGVRLVRTLREEIVELEYQLSEIDSGEAACRAKIQLLQQYIKTNPIIDKTAKTKMQNVNGSAQASGETIDDVDTYQGQDDSAAASTTANGHNSTTTSTALIVRPTGGSQGFLPFSIWQLFLRIMGLSHNNIIIQQQQQQQRMAYDRPAMIV